MSDRQQKAAKTKIDVCLRLGDVLITLQLDKNVQTDSFVSKREAERERQTKEKKQ